jgi:hypothetical protein
MMNWHSLGGRPAGKLGGMHLRQIGSYGPMTRVRQTSWSLWEAWLPAIQVCMSAIALDGHGCCPAPDRLDDC